jgi:hypothetical protein
MASVNNTLYSIYNNLYTFFNYRDLKPLDIKLEYDEFIKHIYNNEYCLIHTVNNTIINNDELDNIKNNIYKLKYKNINKYKITYVLLFHHSTEIHSKSPEIKKILNKVLIVLKIYVSYSKLKIQYLNKKLPYNCIIN